jgi:hypothetical protein
MHHLQCFVLNQIYVFCEGQKEKFFLKVLDIIGKKLIGNMQKLLYGTQD